MQTTKNIKIAGLLAVLLCFGLGSAQAALYKADNANNLNVGASWVLGGVPGSSDVAGWDSTVAVNTSSLLGADLSWAGIQILNPGGPITINGANTLTLGASGIDMSSASQSLVLSNRVVLGADQIWNVTAGQSLTAPATNTLGSITGTGVLTKNGNGTLILVGTNTYTGGTVVNAGVLQVQYCTTNGILRRICPVGSGWLTNNDGTTIRIGSAGCYINTDFTPVGTVIIDLNYFSALMNGAWHGSGTVIVTNGATGSTFTVGGNGSVGAGNMNDFSGTIKMASMTGAGQLQTNNLRFNDSGGNNNLGSANCVVDLGNGTNVLTTRNRLNNTISLGELWGGVNSAVKVGSSGSGGTTYAVGGKNTDSTFGGMFDGTGATSGNFLALTKVGSGKFTLTGPNSYNGVTTISAGTLQIDNGGTTGQLGTGSVVNNASLVFDRADSIAVTNNVSGSGTLTKLTPGTTLTYYGANTSFGATIISQGTVAVAAAGSMACPVSVASGAFFDVTANGNYNNTLSGIGTVNGTLTSSGGTISPGGVGAAGTLNFANDLIENGTVNNQMELSTPSGANDLINITGSLTVNPGNTITLSRLGGGQIPIGTYTLFTYGGSFNGSLANFTVVAPNNTATLINPANQIRVIVGLPPRNSTNLTWVGDNAANVWDVGTSNWVSTLGVQPFDFRQGDDVRFDARGAANPIVTVAVPVSPNSMVVSNTANYTFTGSGSIGGATGLVKTNSGTLTVQTVNSYTGPTVIGGGTLVASTLANGNVNSAIGAAGSNPTNLVFFGTTLGYTGPNTATDRGATLNGSGGTFDIIGGTTLTNSGLIAGPGALTLIDSGTLILVNPNTYAGGTVLSNGVLALGSSAANNNLTGGSGVGPTNEPVTFYGGTLQLFGPEPGINYNTFYNPLVVPAGQTGTLIMFPRGPANSGANSGLQSSLTGSGILNLEVNYVRDDLSGNWSGFTGLINVTPLNAGDSMRINNNFGYANATFYLNDNVTLQRSSTANTTNDIGALNGSSLSVVGPGLGSGLNPTYRVGWLNTDATFNGTIADDGSTTIIKVGTGRWNLNGYNLWTGPTIISNGVLAVNSLYSSNINVCAGAFLDVSAAGTLSLGTGQTLSGNGTVLGSVDVSGGGTIAPGSSIGTLTVTNTVNFGGGGALMEVNHNGGVPVSDQLVAPAISLGGTLSLHVLGSRLQVNDTFHLFSGTLSGSFTTFNLGYYTWNTSQLGAGGNGTIRVTGLLPLPTAGVTVSGTNIVLSSTGGLHGGQLTVVTSTNVAAPLSAWTTITNDVFDGTGQYSLTVPMNSGSAEQFYLIEVF
jgi:autotransporter-associated beta strand protein